MNQNKPAETKVNEEALADTIKFKNIGFVNQQWTEIVVEDDEECESISKDEVKKAIIQLTEREKHNPLYNYTEKYIRVKHKTYVPVEVCKDRNCRMIYAPLKSINRPELSLGVKVRTSKIPDNMNQQINNQVTNHEFPVKNRKHSTGFPSTHDKPSGLSFGEKERPQIIEEASDDEITEVEYPPCKNCSRKVSFPDTKIKVDIEIIGKNSSRTGALNKQHRIYNTCMRKQELLQLINEEMKLEIEQQINVVDIIEQASRIEESQDVEIHEDWETKAEEIRSELKKVCIEIESKWLAECSQTDITSHKIEMTDNKPIRHKVRPVPYHCRKEFEQIIKDQLAAGIIRPSTSATCSPVNLVLKEDGSLRLTIDYRKVNNATLPDPNPLPRIDDIIARLAKNRFFSKIDLANGYYQVKMHRDSIKFISEFGKHEYLAMPMFLKNAGSTFQRMMDKVLDGLI